MLKRLLAIGAGLSLALTVYAATELVANAPDRYVVRKGDTLWDISARFLGKPWHWPEIWQDNPQVRNPHLIYPGDELVLGRNGRVGHGPGSIEPHARVTSREQAIAPLPLSDIKQFLSDTRVLDENAFRHAPHVVGMEENRLRATAGQLIYVRGLDARVGDQFALVRPLGRYYDMPPSGDSAVREVYRQPVEPRDGRGAMLWRHGPNEFSFKGRVRLLGYEVQQFGTVRVTRAGNVASALVVYSDFEVRQGDFVLPLDERPYDDNYWPHPPKRVPENMRVIALTDALNAVGPRQVIALSRGAADGVQHGEVFAIYQEGETVVDRTDYPEGSTRALLHPKRKQVRLPPEFIGHVMVFRTFDRVSYGLIMDGVKPVHIGDFLHDPDSTP